MFVIVLLWGLFRINRCYSLAIARQGMVVVVNAGLETRLHSARFRTGIVKIKVAVNSEM